ncbi:MAG: divergent PAP2 family protein [Thermostichales cyanobacterium SZTDM-1c_bins_54]
MLSSLLHNPLLWIALSASLMAQVVKLLWFWGRSGQWEWRLLVQTGGMPSSHAALVSALCAGVGLQEGWDSVLFAACCVFAVIVMYDAAGIRQAAGQQATVLNRMISTLFDKDHPLSDQELKELLGHTPLQVFVGSILGVLWAIMLSQVWGIFPAQ